MSTSGSGATCVIVPTPPLHLINNGAITSETVIGFSWSQVASSGGLPILDYLITYDQGFNSWV